MIIARDVQITDQVGIRFEAYKKGEAPESHTDVYLTFSADRAMSMQLPREKLHELRKAMRDVAFAAAPHRLRQNIDGYALRQRRALATIIVALDVMEDDLFFDEDVGELVKELRGVVGMYVVPDRADDAIHDWARAFLTKDLPELLPL